jgi:filamentous hemagglutinin family protein
MSLINPSKELSADSAIGKFFVATVVGQPTVGDPHRVRVRVPDLMSEYPDVDCPWAAISRPVWRGDGGGVGVNAVPRNGTKVLVVFDKGDVNSPIILGELGSSNVNPNRYGWSDENGNSLWFDVVAHTLTVTNSGATITVSGSGQVTIHSPAGITINSDATIALAGTGSVTVTSGSSVTVTAPSINLN